MQQGHLALPVAGEKTPRLLAEYYPVSGSPQDASMDGNCSYWKLPQLSV